MIEYKIYTSYNELPGSWESLTKHDVFLQLDYLNALENGAPDTITMYYVGLFVDKNLVGLAIIQRVQVYAKDVFRSYSNSILKEFFKTGVSKILKGNVLVVGNLTQTGQHGLFFNSDKIELNSYLEAIFKAVNELKTIIKRDEKKTIRVIMFKDYFIDDNIHNASSLFETNKLHKVSVQPNMIMDVKTQWESFQDYLDALNKKYKRRHKTALKKRNSIIAKELDIDAILENAERMHELYLNVSSHAKFNTFLLPENHFHILKQRLAERFKVFAYYLDDMLVGFYTLILNNETLETYFLGYDSKEQYNHQLYLNMLYDMAHYGIDNKFKTIVYARTAMEIKSSVGAAKVNMSMYMKHTNKIANFMFKQVFNVMNPKQRWVERHPFKI